MADTIPDTGPNTVPETTIPEITTETTTPQHDEPQEEPRSERALRVSQLDADEMDNGLIHMLNAKISRALSVFGVSLSDLQRS
jgi:hypothetical protein